MLQNRRLSVCLIVVLCLGSSQFSRGAEQATRPNIIVMMSDDMGYSDLGCYGGDVLTPNLDALAAGGVRFTQFYNTARCCPTRASLLTGLYPHQAGVGHMVNDRGVDGYRGELNRQSVTIAEVLRPAGYRTYMCGKWHVTANTQQAGSHANWPLQRGFEKFYGTIAGAGNFFEPKSLCRQDTIITPETDPEYTPQQFYYTDAISDNAVSYLKQHSQETPDQPFFLYVAYTAAHWPLHALEKDIARYQGHYDDGYAPHRFARLERMKKMGLLASDITLSPGAEDWEKVENHAWEARCMEVYAAMIDNMDAGIGRITAQLKASGKWDNTLIFYLQDNGACAEAVGRKAVAGKSKQADEPRSGPGVMPGPADTHIAYGRGWANVSNTPFREYKHWVHEGGISTPLIAHWPAEIPQERAGQLETQPGHLIDIMATCVDVSGASYPGEFSGQSIKPREGVSLRPALTGKPLGRTQPLFWEHEGNRAIRDGNWKLVAKENQPWELYDIGHDRIESQDLADSQSKLVKELAAKWDAYAERANVLPLGAWRGGATPKAENQSEIHFEFKAGDQAAAAQAPDVGGRGFTVKAKIAVKAANRNGVIVAQGGSRNGFSLFLTDGKPTFFIRTPAGNRAITGKESLTGEHTIEPTIDRQGTLSLLVDGHVAADKVSAHFLTKTPTDGLQIGRDDGAAVGPYESPNLFSDSIESVTIDLLEPPAGK